jgi:hypothetical protein
LRGLLGQRVLEGRNSSLFFCFYFCQTRTRS